MARGKVNVLWPFLRGKRTCERRGGQREGGNDPSYSELFVKARGGEEKKLLVMHLILREL